MYTPDNWVVLKILGDKPFYKVLAGWSGGYLDGDSWRMNSGIVDCRKEGGYFIFVGNSRSEYKCHKNAYGLRMNNAYIYEKMKDRVEMMPEETDWLAMDWPL